MTRLQGWLLIALVGVAVMGAGAFGLYFLVVLPLVERNRRGEEAGMRAADSRTRVQQEEDVAKIRAKSLDLPVQSYYLKHRQWPTDLSVLTQPDEVNANSPYVADDNILDPWGQPYEINTAGPNNKGAKPDIFTTSPSGKMIGNWGR
jgi:hypothetical protein